MKIGFVLLCCFVFLANSSCKKTYACVCNAVDTSGAPMNYQTKIDGSMNDAQNRCSTQRNTYDTVVYKHLTCGVPI